MELTVDFSAFKGRGISTGGIPICQLVSISFTLEVVTLEGGVRDHRRIAAFSFPHIAEMVSQWQSE